MTALRLPPPRTPAFFVEDMPGMIPPGFLPTDEAASTMGLTEDELVEAVRRDYLEGVLVGQLLYVRPAIVSLLGVDDGSRA